MAVRFTFEQHQWPTCTISSHMFNVTINNAVVHGKAHLSNPLLPEQPQCSVQEGREEEKWKNVSNDPLSSSWMMNEVDN